MQRFCGRAFPSLQLMMMVQLGIESLDVFETYQSGCSQILLIHGLADLLYRQSQLATFDEAVSIPHTPELAHVLCPLAPSLDDTPVDLLHRPAEMLLELVGKHLRVVESLIGVLERV